MPSNEKLTASIKELDAEFNEEGKSNADMVAILKELRLKAEILELDATAELDGATFEELTDILKGTKLVLSIFGLDENADTEGKTLEELVALLEELTPEPGDPAKEAADAKTAATKVKKEKAAEEKAAKKPPYTIANGKAITTKRGILAEGDEIKAKDLPGGKEAIDKFVKSGHIVKN